MITAPRQYANKLASLLISAGARPVWLPAISITHLTDATQVQVSLTDVLCWCDIKHAGCQLLTVMPLAKTPV